MVITQLVDDIVPQEFTDYQVENSLLSTAFVELGAEIPVGCSVSERRDRLRVQVTADSHRAKLTEKVVACLRSRSAGRLGCGCGSA